MGRREGRWEGGREKQEGRKERGDGVGQGGDGEGGREKADMHMWCVPGGPVLG